MTAAKSADLWEQLADEYEEIVFCHDAPTGLRAIIAIHSTLPRAD